MDFLVQFTFQNKISKAAFFIDYKEEPCFIFVLLQDEELIKEFGDELTLKTDCEQVLELGPSNNKLDNLRLAIFEAVKTTKKFAEIKSLYPTGKKWPARQ